jgi:CP family cyanate transporter-like MFS transporter
LLVPLVSAHPAFAAAIVATAGATATAGWIGLLVAPAFAPALWCVLLGLGALTFPLMFVQLAVRAHTPETTVRLSSFVQTFAYVATGLLVFALGPLHDATGDWTAPIVVLLVVATFPLLAVPVIARDGRVDDPRSGG